MSEAGNGALKKKRSVRPAVRYDFSKGYIAQTLPPEAVVQMRGRGIGTNQMEAELRNYLRFKGLDEVRPIRVLQIVSRFVDVYPVSFIDMERALGREAARKAMSEVPEFTWMVQDFLDYIDVRRGHRYREEVNLMIESMIARGPDFAAVARRHLARTGYNVGDVLRHRRQQREARAARAEILRSI